MMMDLKQTLTVIDSWLAKKRSDNSFPAEIQFSRSRMEYALDNRR